MNDIRTQFRELRQGLTDRHIERYDEVEIALNALLSQYHVVLLGPPGTAKSMLATDLVHTFTGATLFKYLFGKFTTPEEVFGPLDVSKLQDGKYERIMTGKLAEAEIAFIDEFFKANTAIQNALLTAMNERQYDHGTQRIDIPLMSLFAASNELPEGEELWALYDRFHFRKIVSYIQEPSNFVKMLTAPQAVELPHIPIADLRRAQQAVLQVNVSDSVYDTLVAIRSDMQLEGIIVSDRRYRQTVRALQSSAWLFERDAVTDEDFSILQHMLWTNPIEAKPVSRIILNHTNPLELAAQEIIDMADEIASQLHAAMLDAKQKGIEAEQSLTRQGIEWFTRCRQLGEQVTDLEGKASKEGVEVNRIKQARDRVWFVASEIGQHAIGLDAMDLSMGK